MSYSFSITGETKAAARARIERELEQVVIAQAVHKVDRDQAQIAANAVLDVLPNANEGEVYAVTVSGYVSWKEVGDVKQITGASIQVSASIKQQ